MGWEALAKGTAGAATGLALAVGAWHVGGWALGLNNQSWLQSDQPNYDGEADIQQGIKNPDKNGLSRSAAYRAVNANVNALLAHRDDNNPEYNGLRCTHTTLFSGISQTDINNAAAGIKKTVPQDGEIAMRAAVKRRVNEQAVNDPLSLLSLDTCFAVDPKNPVKVGVVVVTPDTFVANVHKLNGENIGPGMSVFGYNLENQGGRLTAGTLRVLLTLAAFSAGPFLVGAGIFGGRNRP